MPEPGEPHSEADNPDSTISTGSERKQVEERLAIPSNVIYETIRRQGNEELARSWQTLAWSGLAAGLSMGFSLVAEGLLAARLPHAAWTPLISRLGYCLGFLIVVLGRQQLFTENTLTAVLPFLVRRDRKTLLSVLRLWGIVLLLNLVGTFFFAFIIGRSAMFPPHVRQIFLEIGQDHLRVHFGAELLRAVFAGWLIALMVWLLPAAHSSRVSIIVIITYVIGLGSFSHVVAGSTTVFYLVVTGAASWGQYVAGFFLPAVAGNIIGGVALVAALGYAQLSARHRQSL
ncbi:MAG: formate/nitrite transporter family protein [Terriglobales bacterium]